MTIGPAPLDHETRLQVALSIAEKLMSHFEEDLVAIGLYGSVAQGTDSPYSDIEMHCVVEAPVLDTSIEWSAGDWKAEIDLKNVKAIMKRAASVEITWAVTHSIFVYTQPIYDPSNLFLHLQRTALSQPDLLFQKAMRALIVEELYELAGKVRNMEHRQDYSMLPSYAASAARWGACLIGLANRNIYPSGGVALKNSLKLQDRPAGYDTLCRMVMAGELSDSKAVAGAFEDFWLGVNAWAAQRGLQLTDDLEHLLAALKVG